MIVNKQTVNFNTVMRVPAGANLIAVKMQHGEPTVWYEFEDSDEPDVIIEFLQMGTGCEFDAEDWTYIDTLLDGMYVWHIYVREFLG